MRVYVGRIISAFLAIIGMTVLLYPTAAAWTNQYNQSTIIRGLDKKIDHAQPGAAEQIAEAHKYNSALKAGARLAPNTNVPLSDVKQAEENLGLWDYEKILNLYNSGIMGRILVPKAEVDIPIYHGTSDETLLKGAGHLQGTSLPVGGKGTRTVITAHRGLAEATMFTYLDRLEPGDTFTLNIFNQVLSYRVVSVKVVEPEESESIKVDPDRDLATLVTCTPLGINTHRILVTGERIHPTPKADEQEAKAPSDLPHFPWFAVGYGVFFVAASYVISYSAFAIVALKRGNIRPKHQQ